MIVALFILVAAPREVPQVVALSAMLEEGGAPVSRTIEAGFVLWDAPDGGAAVWSESYPALDVVDGVLAVEIGASRPLPPGAFAKPTWLEIIVDGQSLEPRARLASAPYAIEAAHAADADTIAGLGVDELVAQSVALPIYVTAAGCQSGDGALTTHPFCVSRVCTGGAVDCDGVCQVNVVTSFTCSNAIFGYVRGPP